MCFFPRFNKNSLKDKWQPSEFDCGYCPECLAKKARFWALRCSMQAQIQDGYMITLTYDNYERDNCGKLTGRELPPNRDLHVCKTDCQKFIKRLRQYTVYGVQREFNKKLSNFLKKYHYRERPKIREKYADAIANRRNEYVSQRVEKISYLLTAEYGNRTGRAHYHALIFGLKLPDLVPYKRSKRGNQIYKSATLERIWNNGICTVDSININGKTARYCTKYCAKDSNRCDDTFMLFSHGIGDTELLRQFNAKSYIIDGREYPIPKLIWDKKIEYAYRNCKNFQLFASRKYRSLRWFVDNNESDFTYLIKMPYGRRIPYISSLYKKSGKELVRMWLDDKFLMPCRFSPVTFEVRQRMRNYKNSKVHFLNFVNASAYAAYFANMRKNAVFRRFKRFYRPYQKYLKYWKNKSDVYNLNRGNAFQRVSALPDDKYFAYKLRAFKALNDYANCGSFVKGVYTVPRSEKVICPDPSCHKGANDIKNMNFVYLRDMLSGKVVKKVLRSRSF